MANTKITTAVIKDDAITTAKIADDAVTGALIADDVALAGNPTTTTQSAGNNTTRIATTAFVTTAINNLVDSAPAALDTLNELAAAMGDDANFSTTVTNSIATKAALAGATFTGDSGVNKESPAFTLQDTSSSRTLLHFVDNNNSVVRASGPLLLQSGGATSAITLDASQNATFGGNVGIGGAPDSDVALHLKGDGQRFQINSDDYNLVSLGRRGSSGADLDKGYFRLRNASTNTVVLDTDGASYFNGGSVGIGVVPETYQGSYRALQVANSALIGRSGSTSETYLTANAYYDGTWRYIKTDEASVVAQSGGVISFLNAASGSADAGISWATVMKIDESGEVNIGGSTAANKTLEIKGASNNDGYLGTFGSGFSLQVARHPLTGAFNNTSTAAAAINLFTASADSSISFYTTTSNNANPTERVQIDKNGNLILKKNLVLESTSEGVDFSGVGSSAQTLDAYEEGTWTPAFANGFDGNYTVQQGQYTKIGRQVIAAFHLDINSASTGSTGNQIKVSGLPFLPDVGTTYGGSTSIHGSSWATGRTSLNMLVFDNNTTAVLYYNMCAGTGASIAPTYADIGTGNLLTVLVYNTDT